MIQRCHNPRNPTYGRYGAKGIRVCYEWRNSFEAFLACVGRAPSADYTIDRIDSRGDYEPGNVRWLLGSQQSANRSNVVRYSFDGEMLTPGEIADRCGIKYATIRWRLKNGWTVEEATNTGADEYHKRSK